MLAHKPIPIASHWYHNLHLLAVLLDVTDIVKNDRGETIQALALAFEPQFLLGRLGLGRSWASKHLESEAIDHVGRTAMAIGRERSNSRVLFRRTRGLGS